MPRTLKLLPLALSLAVPLCAQAARPARQAHAAAARQTPTNDEELERARRLVEQGDAASLKQIAERRKTDDRAWYYLGLALARSNRQKDARKAFERAVGLRESADARTGLALTQFLLGRTREAERDAGRALKLDPGHAQAHYVMAAVRFREDDMEGAVREVEEALRLDPSFAAAAQLGGEALLNIYGEEYERASRRHPVPAGASAEERNAALARREELVEPAKGRLRAAAERLQRFADSAGDAGQKERLGELAATLAFYGRPLKKGDPPGVFRQADVTTKAVIHSKPEPGFTPAAQANGTTGVVRLRAVLGADGRVRHIMVMRRLPDGLTEEAVEAARRIKFTPATVGGRRVSQYVILEYNFIAGLR